MNNKQKIVVITGEPIPNGMACTQRLLNFSRGFVANGVDVTILAIVPHDERCNNKDAKGFVDGIEYVYTCGTAKKSKYFFLRRWHRLKGFLFCASMIYKDRKEIDGVLFIGNGGISLSVFFIGLIARLFSIVTLLERTEIPYFNKTPRGVLGRLGRLFYENIFHRIFSCISVISEELVHYYSCRKAKKIIKVPIIVDKRTPSGVRKKNSAYFMCSGALSQYQSGLVDLVKAFCIVAEKYSDVDLIFTGIPKREDEAECEKVIAKAGVENRVTFKGYIERGELVDLMINAYCFVLPKPDNLQNRYCFASKIAEYMATGNPLITTKLGEICNYCEDEKNVFFVNPDSVEELSDKMIYVLQNSEHAARVGACGKKLSCSVFDNKVQAQKIIDFLRII